MPHLDSFLAFSSSFFSMASRSSSSPDSRIGRILLPSSYLKSIWSCYLLSDISPYTVQICSSSNKTRSLSNRFFSLWPLFIFYCLAVDLAEMGGPMVCTVHPNPLTKGMRRNRSWRWKTLSPSHLLGECGARNTTRVSKMPPSIGPCCFVFLWCPFLLHWLHLVSISSLS